MLSTYISTWQVWYNPRGAGGGGAELSWLCLSLNPLMPSGIWANSTESDQTPSDQVLYCLHTNYIYVQKELI